MCSGIVVAQVLVWFIFESIFQLEQYYEDDWVTHKMRKIYTEEEFDKEVKQGKKLVIVDDLVIDIGSYAYSHPGGAFLIDYNIGRDVSKFIFGAFALDGNQNDPKAPTNKWNHSNMARKIVNRHAIGAMIRTDTAMGRFKICHPEIHEVNAFTKCFPFKSILDKGSRLPGVQNFYDDLAIMGKHYHIGALDEKMNHYREGWRVVRRHYTISNAMRKVFYDELIKAIANFSGALEGKEAEDYEFNAEVLSIKESNQMNITVKNYNLPCGMSRRLFMDVDNNIAKLPTETYKMVGPLGKGLGITPHTTGCHFAYSAGTGILVFIDLVARMLIQELGLLP